MSLDQLHGDWLLNSMCWIVYSRGAEPPTDFGRRMDRALVKRGFAIIIDERAFLTEEGERRALEYGLERLLRD